MPNQTYREHIPFVCNRSSDCINCFFAPVCPMLTSHPHSSRHFASMFFQMCPAKASARQEINEHDGMAVYGWGIMTCS